MKRQKKTERVLKERKTKLKLSFKTWWLYEWMERRYGEKRISTTKKNSYPSRTERRNKDKIYEGGREES
jgi:hypothetical protein